MLLKAEQSRLYALLPSDIRCFVRVCDDDCALWVSDLPRRMPECAQLAEMLRREGFVAAVDEKTQLWHLDWTEARWQEILNQFPRKLPPLPENERYHEAYALCRLLLLHPAQPCDSGCSMIRRMMKLTAGAESKLMHAIRELHARASLQLRTEGWLASEAGCILAAWLQEHAYGKERET